jgi:hypothetical protein
VLGDGLLVGLGLVVGLVVGLGLLLGRGLLLGLGPLLVGRGDGLLGLGSGLVLIVGVGVGVLVGLGLLLLGLGDGLWLCFVLSDSAPSVLRVRLPAAFPLTPRDCFADLPGLALCAADFEISDADAASAVAPLCRALTAAVTAAVAGRVVHALLAADADVTCVPAKNTLTRPHETTAVPAHAPRVAGPPRRVITVLNPLQSLPRQGLRSVASLITLCSPPKWAFPSVPIRHL